MRRKSASVKIKAKRFLGEWCKSVENLQGGCMSKEIAQKIRAGYGDMRKSEQKAADFILEHLDTSRSAGSVRIPQDRKEDRTPI